MLLGNGQLSPNIEKVPPLNACLNLSPSMKRNKPRRGGVRSSVMKIQHLSVRIDGLMSDRYDS